MRSDAEMLRIVQARARQIHRRRRAAVATVVGTAVLLVAISAAALGPGNGGRSEVRTGGDTTEATTATTPTTSTDVTDTTATSSTTTPVTSPPPSDTSTSTTAPASTTTAPPASTTTTVPPKLCDPSQVDAFVAPTQTTYALGDNVIFDAHAHNISDQACPETGWSFEIVIRDSEGHVVLWIQVSYGGSLPFELKPGQDEWERFIWDQTSCSQPSMVDSCLHSPHVGPGTYTISSDIGGYVSSAQVTIT
jgi:hypothetical protein